MRIISCTNFLHRSMPGKHEALRCWFDVGPRRRRLANIDPALVQFLVFDRCFSCLLGSLHNVTLFFNKIFFNAMLFDSVSQA